MTLNLIVPDLGDVTDPETIAQIFADLTSLRSDVDTLLSKVTRRVRVSADQNLNTSSTTLQNVTGIVLSVEANTQYEGVVDAAWTLATGTTEDIKFGFSFPAGAQMDMGGAGPTTALGAATAVADGDFVRRQSITSASTTVAYGASTTIAGALIFFQITTSSTAGNLQLMAAQNTSGGNIVTVEAGTRMMMWKASS